jgi:hypothetical protein
VRAPWAKTEDRGQRTEVRTSVAKADRLKSGEAEIGKRNVGRVFISGI